MSRFVDVAATGEIPVGESRSFEIEDRSVAVFHTAEGFFAIDNLCPHMGAPLVDGHLEGCVVTCPWHAWRFDVRDGTWCENPRIKTDSFPLRIVGDRIQVAIEEKTDPIPDDFHTKSGKSEGSSMTGQNIDKPEPAPVDGPTIADFQRLIHRMYYEKDVVRGVSGTFVWMIEEIGELATALRSDDRENLAAEFADVLAWLATIANVAGVDLAAAVSEKYGRGCPGCEKLVCCCPDSEKP